MGKGQAEGCATIGWFYHMRTVAAAGLAIGSDDILEGIERIRSSPTFTHSRRLLELLDLVVSTTLRGDGSTLNESAIGHALYHAGDNLELASIVRTQARRLRERLSEYYSQEGAQDPILIGIREDGLVPTFARRIPPTTPAVLWTIAAAALVIGGGMFAYLRATHRKSGR
jgi:hypothetical protein